MYDYKPPIYFWALLFLGIPGKLKLVPCTDQSTCRVSNNMSFVNGIMFEHLTDEQLVIKLNSS